MKKTAALEKKKLISQKNVLRASQCFYEPLDLGDKFIRPWLIKFDSQCHQSVGTWSSLISVLNEPDLLP